MILLSNNAKAVQKAMLMIKNSKIVLSKSLIVRMVRYIMKSKKFANVHKKNHSLLDNNVFPAHCLGSGISNLKHVLVAPTINITIQKQENAKNASKDSNLISQLISVSVRVLSLPLQLVQKIGHSLTEKDVLFATFRNTGTMIIRHVNLVLQVNTTTLK